MKLNKQQEEAANHLDGPCLVTACPGSGKTATLTTRTQRLIDKGVHPYSILCITFTNKAANEMRSRIEKNVGEIPSKQIFISTFHRLCSFLLRKYGHPLGYNERLTILDEDGQVDLMSQCTRQLGHEYTKPQIKSIAWNINDARENLETPDQISDRFDQFDSNYLTIAEEYLKRLQATNCIDFTGLLSTTYTLLKNHKSVLDACHNRWRYFQIDEIQDTNLAQFKIIELLGSHTNNIFLVGDIDQSVYQWRGARIENIHDFIKAHAGIKVLSLGENYRSTPQIVAVAAKLIAHNPNRIAAPFVTNNPDGSPVICKAHRDDRSESEAVARTIQDLVTTRKCNYKDIAVFYRMNSMSRAIEMALINYGIPHTLIGSFSFFDRKEIKDTLAMLRFMVNPLDGVSFHRFSNRPKRALGDVTVGKIESYAAANSIPITDAICNMQFKSESVNDGLNEIKKAFNFDWKSQPIADTLQHLIISLRYEEYLKEDTETYEERMDNLDELVKDAARFGEEKGQDLVAYLEQCTLVSTSDKEADGNSVSLMTLHAAKGLEFPVVFMIGVEQGILPHARAVAERLDGVEEERRLAFVGMTRAEKLLLVNYCQRRQEGYGGRGKVNYKTATPSQFLIESGLLASPKNKSTGSNWKDDYY